MRRSNLDKPFYVDVGTSVVAIRCASNHDVLMRYDYSWNPHLLNLAKEVCDRMNKELRIEVEQMERIVRDEILSYEQLYKEVTNDDAELEIYERCAIAQGWLVSHGFERQKVSFAKEIVPRPDGDLPLGKEVPFEECFV